MVRSRGKSVGGAQSTPQSIYCVTVHGTWNRWNAAPCNACHECDAQRDPYQPPSIQVSLQGKKGKRYDLFIPPPISIFRSSDPEQRRARLTTARTNGRVLSMFVTMEETGHNRGRSSKVIANRSTSPDRETYFKTDLCSSL